MAAVVDTIRRECLSQLHQLSSAHHSSFAELEGRLYDWAGKPQSLFQLYGAYYRKYIQLYYDLRQHYAYLLSRYTPSELLCLSETELNPHTQQEREHDEEQYRLYKQILAKGIEDEDEEKDEDADGGNKCRKCKNTRGISILLRQLRSADEPASAFFTCGKCGFEWRVG